MSARAGMLNLLARWRRMVNDTAGSVWNDTEAQELLDTYRVDIYAGELEAAPQYVSGTTVYKVHMSPWENLEEAASGSTNFRLYDANGSEISSGYTADWQRGVFTFTADQRGSARYIDAKAYDLNAAAADGWRELMGAKASFYKFTADGATYERQQWFEHCQAMARYYDNLTKPTYTTLERTDLA